MLPQFRQPNVDAIPALIGRIGNQFEAASNTWRPILPAEKCNRSR